MKKIFEYLKTNVFKNKKNLIVALACLTLTLILSCVTGIAFVKFTKYNTYFYVSDSVTDIQKFSDYSPSLKNTTGDADIYVLEGKEKGPSILILGGTHPNEPSGQMTATLLLENLKVNKGTVYIITEANRSAFTQSYPQEGSPFYYTLETASGKTRTFKFGSRATNTNEQWPNPDVYVHEYSGQKLSTNETRNLNRAYPGVENGTYTERVAYAITELIRKNDITVTIDLHEASPEYLTINACVAHQRSRTVYDGADDKINDNIVTYHTEVEGMETTEAGKKGIHGEDSPTNLHGLTHRELGDYTNTLALLLETSNAAQGKYRGAFTTDLITYGENSDDYEGDKFYEKAVELDGGLNDGCLYARPVTLTERVARHTESIYQIIQSYNKRYVRRALYDNSEVVTAATLKEASEIDACLEKRIAAGKFDIDFSALYNTDDYDSLYASIMSNKVGSFLHDEA